MLKKTLLAAAVLGLSATAVQANEISGYATYSIGHAQADKPKVAKEVIDVFKVFGSSTSTDRSSTGHKIAVGFKFNPYLALEAQYIDLGSSSYKGVYSVPPAYLSGKIDLKTAGLGGNLVGIYPIEDFTLFAKAGYHALRTKGTFKIVSSVPGDTRTYKETINKWAPSIGIGASYDMTKELAVVAEYELYKGVANKTVNGEKFKHDIDFASIGLRYTF